MQTGTCFYLTPYLKMKPELVTIQSLAKKLLQRETVFRTLPKSNPLRKLLTWGYRIEVLQGTLNPIESDPNKKDYWEDALKHDLTREERIEYCKALYYLVQKA